MGGRGWAPPSHQQPRLAAGARSMVAFQPACPRHPGTEAATGDVERIPPSPHPPIRPHPPNHVQADWLELSLNITSESRASPPQREKEGGREREGERRAFQGGVRRRAVAPPCSVEAVTLSLSGHYFCASQLWLVCTSGAFCLSPCCSRPRRASFQEELWRFHPWVRPARPGLNCSFSSPPHPLVPPRSRSLFNHEPKRLQRQPPLPTRSNHER